MEIPEDILKMKDEQIQSVRDLLDECVDSIDPTERKELEDLLNSLMAGKTTESLQESREKLTNKAMSKFQDKLKAIATVADATLFGVALDGKVFVGMSGSSVHLALLKCRLDKSFMHQFDNENCYERTEEELKKDSFN